MKLKVIGSSSGGNCYILKPDSGKMLILEAGINIKEVGKMLTYKWKDVAGVLITHEHQDHAAYVSEFQARGIKVYATSETAERINNQVIPLQFVSKKNVLQIEDFKVMWFDTVHDAAHPVSYFISHPEMGKLLFITDTAEISQKFRGVNHLCIETNYDPNNAAFARLSESYTNRVLLSHLSIDQAEKFIINNILDKEKLESVTLLHLSSRHADKQDFPKRIKKTLSKLGRDIPVEVAQPYTIINLKQYERPNF
ncbi:MAG: MBL fold metallo-hydrolase [Bacteroidales bacterium]|nr:MBL fold metallo-hydrolase [Bacteroidales bacterium]